MNQNKQIVMNYYRDELLNYDVSKDYPKMVEIGGSNE